MTYPVTAAALTVLTLLIVILTGSVHRCRRDLRRAGFAQRSEAGLLTSYLSRQRLDVDLSQHDVTYVDDAVVFIVGGGGTIGGQLARELCELPHRRLVLVDNDENGLYRMLRTHPARGHRPEAISGELVDVRDEKAISRLFARYRPDVVFHYANYKSAALSGTSPRAFVQVNIAGMLNLLRAVRRTPSVKNFVYVSSDKAESASTTYGRTKRICELLMHVHATDTSPVRYASIRYCNVLDAAGSFAIPTFREQILSGKPVTVRRMDDGSLPNRYYMDIRTAALIALVAGARGRNGEVFSLDARRVAPIDVDEIVRILARASGIRNVQRWFDRNVTYVPPTPGEKTTEELGEGSSLPHCPLADLHSTGPVDADEFRTSVEEFLETSEAMDDEQLTRLLDRLLVAHDTGARRTASAGDRAAPAAVLTASGGGGGHDARA